MEENKENEMEAEDKGKRLSSVLQIISLCLSSVNLILLLIIAAR
ncbi:MAG: hypothetical protein PHO44_07210 [Sphaerochaetaceae bacterium]|nr:hypothetical protein [Sphaerochaetaceae bacterium]MDD3163997.1 hypothetical protein [Sphaerochaetaceae bacterium]MDD4007754.1 hypothetical protein [Sphaerochaetaceae bacterium]MDD4396852.1 hypothetical protein [Sphaerochaetaceae bacterium]